MPEDFETALRDVVSDGATAARLRTVDQIKERARRRSNNRRAGGAMLSLVLAGAVAGSAIGLSGHGHRDNVVRPAAPTSSASTPSPTGSATPSTTPTPTHHAITPTHAPSSPPATGNTPPAVALPNPGTYTAAAWLSAGQLPLDGTYGWTPVHGSAGAPGATTLGPVSATPLSQLQGLTQCGPQAQVLDQQGGTIAQWMGYDTSPKSTTINASQWLIFFSTPAKASAAMAALTGEYAGCHNVASPTPVTVTTADTLSAPDAGAWTAEVRASGPTPNPGYAAGGDDTHDYYVLRGTVIALVETRGSTAVDSSSGDGTVIAALRQALAAAYPQS